MTFLEMRQRVAEALGVSETDTTTDANATIQAKIKAWINARYTYVCGIRDWNWLLKDTIIQTAAQITTGTVTATLASTTITFSNAPAPSVAGWFIQFSDSSDWYEISTHTAGQTGAVLANAYLGTTSSTLTYTLRKVYYVMPTDTGTIMDMRQMRQKSKLKWVSLRNIDSVVPDRNRVDQPQYYTTVGLDSSGQIRVEFFPVASTTMNINVRYYKVVAEMTSDSEKAIIPKQFHEYLVWDTLGTYGYNWLDDTRISMAKAEANRVLEEMISNDTVSEGIAVRQEYDVNTESDSNYFLRRLNLPIAEI